MFKAPAVGRVENNSSTKQPRNISVRLRNGKRRIFADRETPQRKGQRALSTAEDGAGKRQKVSETELSEDVANAGDKTSADHGEGPNRRLTLLELDHSQSSNARNNIRRDTFEAKYYQLNLLGEGGHGSVYAGYRKTDLFPVAIKHIMRNNIICRGIKVNRKMVPMEVAVMVKLSSGASDSIGKSASISLLDYYELEQELILILERPVPCVNLLTYIKFKGGGLREEEARLLFEQLVNVAKEFQSKNIFHRDIKLENILVETSSEIPRLRLIDFGLSCFTKRTSAYSIFYGTSAHIPPEWHKGWAYRAGPTTVWQLGIVLYEMTHRHKTFETTKFLRKELKISRTLSQHCQSMLRLCLAEDPKERPPLEELPHHPWVGGALKPHTQTFATLIAQHKMRADNQIMSEEHVLECSKAGVLMSRSSSFSSSSFSSSVPSCSTDVQRQQQCNASTASSRDAHPER